MNGQTSLQSKDILSKNYFNIHFSYKRLRYCIQPGKKKKKKNGLKCPMNPIKLRKGIYLKAVFRSNDQQDTEKWMCNMK